MLRNVCIWADIHYRLDDLIDIAHVYFRCLLAFPRTNSITLSFTVVLFYFATIPQLSKAGVN